MTESPILWFDKIGIGDIASVGGKNASLGEMRRTLSGKGVRVPNGFATSADAYRSFIAANRIEAAIRAQLAIYEEGKATLQEAGHAIRSLFLDSEATTRSR